MTRLVFWVQSLLGTGHLRRALALVRGLADAGFEVVLVNGGPPSPWPVPPRAELIQLEPLRAADESFSGLVGEDGRAVTEGLWRRRAEQLAQLADRFPPQIVVTELFPFGRRAFARELLPWLGALRERDPRRMFVCSVRDLLVSKPRPERHVEVAERVRRWFDLVLVHSDPAIVPFGQSFPLIGRIQDRLRYTGYVVDGGAPPRPAGAARSGVVVSAGGGAVGTELIECALEARGLCRFAAEPWTLLAGARAPAAKVAAWQARAPAGVRVLAHHPDPPELLAGARMSVSQAGYNSVVEALACRTPMVLVPFAAAGEDEQTVRARRLAESGIARLVEAGSLSPQRLAAAIDELGDSCGTFPRVALDGVARSVAFLRAATGRRGMP